MQMSLVPTWAGGHPALCLWPMAQLLPGKNPQDLSLYHRGRGSWRPPALRSWTALTQMSVWVFVFGMELNNFHLVRSEQIMIEVLVYWIQDEIVGRRSASSSSLATSLMDDTSPESAVGKKSELGIIYTFLSQLRVFIFLVLSLVRSSWTLIRSIDWIFSVKYLTFFFSPAPPMFLPISSTPQPERRQTPQRRHSIEKETPTNVRQFQPPTKQSSKSLVGQVSL